MQDLLAMTALQLATKPKVSSVSVPTEPDFSLIEKELEVLSSELKGLE